MNVRVAIAAATVIGTVLGFALNGATVRYLRRRVKELRSAAQEGKGPVKMETMKRVVWACVTNGFAWVWCSYILAAMDKSQIAEELSKVALAEIIVPVAVYAGKSALENLSKNNRWPDKPETLARENGDFYTEAVGGHQNCDRDKPGDEQEEDK